jgi:tetratricopeptide (TPR) repeat protein
VITAAHVVEDAESIRLRFDPDLPTERVVVSTSWCAIAGSDLGIIDIAPSEGEKSLIPARFGRIGARPAVLDVQAVGFPRWKMREAAGDQNATIRYRDAFQAVGTVAVLSNWREGSLEIEVSAGPAPDDNPGSPWEGMSGAALWVGDCVIGVVSKHYAADGLARLTAERIDVLLDRAQGQDRERLRSLVFHGCSDELPDVVPASHGELTATAHRAQLAEIAPSVLLDREEELRDLTMFCAGRDTYTWWQAEPWAGKTALLSWFALNPPAGVEVVSFFVVQRLVDQSDSEAFTYSLIEQLAALAGEPPSVSLGARSLGGHLLRLLQLATERCTQAGRRLLLVVDGLDEDTGGTAGLGRPSIASLLPRRPPVGLRVLIASRPSPGVPDDVAPDHPIRSTTARQLLPSPHALRIETAAKAELTRLLKGSAFQREVLGLITASGGGLTRRDLEELTGRAPYEVAELLDGVFGRTIESRTSGAPSEGTSASVCLFAHETLREISERQFGDTLSDYRERLHTWAAFYRGEGWPSRTPIFLLRGYPRLLAAHGDLPRLLSCATDGDRHDRALSLTGGDALGLGEIALAQVLVGRQPSPDLSSCLRLAAHRDELLHRNRDVSEELAFAWAEVGEFARAEGVARSITGGAQQAAALAGLARMEAARGNYEHAVFLATDIARPSLRASAVAEVAMTMAMAGERIRAEALVESAEDQADRDLIRARLVRALAAVGDFDRAEQAATLITTTQHRDAMVTHIVQAIAEAGDHEAAEKTMRRLFVPHPNQEALIVLGRSMARSGAYDHARRLLEEARNEVVRTGALGRGAAVAAEIALLLTVAGARREGAQLLDDAESAALTISDPAKRDVVLADMAFVLAEVKFNRALVVARKIKQLHVLARALVRMSDVAAEAGDMDQAHLLLREAGELAERIDRADLKENIFALIARGLTLVGLDEQAEKVARRIREPEKCARALSMLAGDLARAGDVEKAQRVAHSIGHTREAGKAFATIARQVAVAGDRDSARSLLYDTEHLIRGKTATSRREDARAGLALAEAAMGNWDRAQLLVKRIRIPYARSQAWANVAQLAFAAEETDRGRRLLSRAESTARRIRGMGAQGQALEALTRVAAAVGLADQAEAIAREITSPRRRFSALAGVAGAFAADGSFARAQKLAERIPDFRWRVFALAEISEALHAHGRTDQATAVLAELTAKAKGIHDVKQRAVVRGRLAKGWALCGDDTRASALAFEISGKNEKSMALAWMVEALAGRGDFSRARELCDFIPLTSVKGKAMTTIVKYLALSGQFEASLEESTRIEDEEMRARALVGLAEQALTLAQGSLAGNPLRVKHILAEALVIGDWTKSVKVVARTNQAEFVAARDDLEERWAR